MFTTKALIVGYYGAGNAGDEAILDSMLAQLRASIPNLHPVIISANPDATSSTYGVDCVSSCDKAAIIAAVRWCNLIVLGGGGLLQDYWEIDLDDVFSSKPAPLNYYAYAALSAVYGKTLVLYTVGAGPLTTSAGRFYTRLAAQQASLITVRDTGSGKLLEELGIEPERIHVTADPAFLLRPSEVVADQPRPILGVALRNWNFGVDQERWEAEVAGALDRFLDQHEGSVLFLPFQRSANAWDDDIALARRMQSLMRWRARTVVSEAAGEAAPLAGAIASCDVVLGMRYHSVLFAIGQSVPVVGLIYDPKVRQLFESAGCAAQAIDLAAVQETSLAELLEQSFTRTELRDSLRNAASRLTQAAAETASLVAGLLAEVAPAVPVATTRRWLDELATVAAETGASALPGLAGLRQTIAERRHGLTRSETKPYDVICFPGIDWDFRWMRAQQLMSQFADHGHRVFFLSVTSYLPPGEKPFAVRLLRDGVWEVRLAAPYGLDVYSGVMPEELRRAIVDDLAALAQSFAIGKAVSMLHLSTWAAAAYDLRERLGWPVAYDCMDDWSGFAWMPDALLDQEILLARSCDLMVVTARKLWDKWAPLNPQTILARNAADIEHFQNPSAGPAPIALPVKHPVIGFYGAIDSWFDIELIRRAALERPDYSFVLIGAVYDAPVEQLNALPNVRLFGHQPYQALPACLNHFDVCVIPFKINIVTQSTDPVKFYEYIASGKPVVATRMPELVPYSQVTYLADGPEHFIRLVDEAVNEQDPERRERRRALARENSWAARYEVIHAALQTHLETAWQSRRILFAYPTLSMGGLEVVLQNRVLELLRLGWRVRLIFLEELDGRPLVESTGAEVRICPDESGFAAEVADFQPDWIISIDTPQVLDIMRKSPSRARLVYEVHSTYPHILAPLVARNFLQGVCGIIVPSVSQQQRIQNLLADEQRIEIVPNAVSAGFFEEGQKVKVPAQPVVLWVGRLDTHKNWRAFLEIARQLRDSTNAQFHLISGGFANETDQAELREVVDSCELGDRFQWISTVPHSEMSAVYRAAAASGGCLVSTSAAESFGLAVLEAMVCRCPVVVPDIDGLRELVEHGETGRRYPAGDIELACEQLAETLREPAEQRRRMTEQAFQAACHFSPEAATKRFLSILESWSAPPAETASAATFEPGSHLAAGRTALLRILQQQPETRVAVVCPSLPWSTGSLENRACRWARLLASRGWTVFYCDPLHIPVHGHPFLEVEHNIFLANIPLPVYDVAPKPVVLTDEHGLQQLALFRDPVVIYECKESGGGESSDFSELHSQWLACAAAITVSSEELQNAVSTWRPDALVFPDNQDSWEPLYQQLMDTLDADAARQANPARLQALLAWREQQVEHLQKQLRERDKPAIEILHSAITEQKRILAERDKSIAFLRSEVGNLSSILAERDNAISYLRSELGIRELSLAERERNISPLRDALSRGELELTTLRDQLEQTRFQLNEQQGAITFLKQELASRDATIASHVEGIEFLRGEVSQREAQLARQIETTDAEIQKLRQTIRRLEFLTPWRRWMSSRSGE